MAKQRARGRRSWSRSPNPGTLLSSASARRFPQVSTSLPNSPASSPVSVPNSFALTVRTHPQGPERRTSRIPMGTKEPHEACFPVSADRTPQTASRRLHRLSPRKSHWVLTVSLSFTEPRTCHYLQFTVGKLRHGEANHLFMIPGPGRARAQGWEPRGSCCCSSALSAILTPRGTQLRPLSPPPRS